MAQWHLLQRCKWTLEPCQCPCLRCHRGECGGRNRGGWKGGQEERRNIAGDEVTIEDGDNEWGGRGKQVGGSEWQEKRGQEETSNQTVWNLSGWVQVSRSHWTDKWEEGSWVAAVYEHKSQMWRNWIQHSGNTDAASRQGRWGEEYKAQRRWGGKHTKSWGLVSHIPGIWRHAGTRGCCMDGICIHWLCLTPPVIFQNFLHTLLASLPKVKLE